MSAFSRTGLIDQLSSAAGDGYSKADATYAVDSLNIDYDKQAMKAAEDYLSVGHFSHQGLIEQLESSSGDGYTHAQAVYGADHSGISASAPDKGSTKSSTKGPTAEQKNAIGAAQDYLSVSAFSRTGLIHQLSSAAGDGYSKADASYAVDSLNIDYDKQAVKAAKDYLSVSHFSHQELIQQLESSSGDGYTHAQAVYGADHAD